MNWFKVIFPKMQDITENAAIVHEANKKLDLCLKGNKVDAKSWYDEFWDAFQDNGNRVAYQGAFSCGWTDETFKPKYDIICGSNYNSLFQAFMYSNITDIVGCLNEAGVKFDTSQCTNFNALFQGCKSSTTPHINVLNATSVNYTFYNIKAKSISIENIQPSLKFDSTFCWSSELENLTLTNCVIGQNGFDIHWSTKLSADSLKSIITALSTSTTGLTITLPTTAQANYEAVYGAGSWEALTASRSNWTIAYAQGG